MTELETTEADPAPPNPEPGKPGEPGKPNGKGGQGGSGGRGGIGLTGLTGKPGAGWSDRAMMFLVAALTVVFGFLFIRVSVNQNAIQRVNYEQCQNTVTARVAYNAQQAALAEVARHHLDIPGNVDRARIYEAGSLDVPDCGPDPSEGR